MTEQGAVHFEIWFREAPEGEWQPLRHPDNEGGSVVTEPNRETAEKWRNIVQARLPLGEMEIREVPGEA